MNRAAADAPTEALDLRGHALKSAAHSIATALDRITHLENLARNCREHGYDLPYSGRDLSRAKAAIRLIDGLVRAAHQEGAI